MAARWLGWLPGEKAQALASNEPAIQAVQEADEKLMDVLNLGVPDIAQRLNQAWAKLKGLAATRSQKLDESLIYQQFLGKVEEEDAWTIEIQQLLYVEDYDNSMTAVQCLLKKPSRRILPPTGIAARTSVTTARRWSRPTTSMARASRSIGPS